MLVAASAIHHWIVLAVGQLLAEHLPLLHVVAHHGERPRRHPHAPRPDLEAPDGQPLLHRREALADLAQHLAVVEAEVVDAQLVGAQAAQHRDLPLDLEARACPGRRGTR